MDLYEDIKIIIVNSGMWKVWTIRCVNHFFKPFFADILGRLLKRKLTGAQI